MRSLASFLGVEHPSEDAISLVRKMAFLRLSITGVFEVSTTWFIITIAAALGEGEYFEGLTLLGFLVVIRSIIQTLIDYPSGTLGDRFGQRYVLASGLLCYSLVYWLMSIISIDSEFSIFVVLYVFLALGASLMSGALESWFDNNYRFSMPNDTERKSYGIVIGRLGMLVKLSAILVIIPGSWLATTISRIFVFQLQTVFCIFTSMIVVSVVRDFEGASTVTENSEEHESYRSLLSNGLRFLSSSRFITFTTIGDVLLNAIFLTFWMIVYYPFLFFYLLSDIAVSSYRTIGILSAAVEQERSGIWSKRFNPVQWIPRLRFLSSFLFYILFALVVYTFPGAIEGSTIIQILFPFGNAVIIEFPISSLIPVILTLAVFTTTGFLSSFADVLNQRIYLDVIPDQIRTSWYSLIPTLRTLVMIPLVIFIGWVAGTFGLSFTFLLFSLLATIGALLIRVGFNYPIPR